ncbi:MAG: hypothetical protein KQI62_02170 [Deltaproteobacteria bacterium]|nr:hypothetical protein [Deltaproteobacteria bacterium]
MPELISQAEYSRRRGVTRQAVSKWVKQGTIPIDPETKKIDPAAADAALEANLDTSKQRDSKPGPVKARAPKGEGDNEARPESTLTKARTQREIIQAQRAKVELDLLQGTVVKTQLVEDSTFEAGRLFRDQLRGLPAKLAKRLAVAATPVECSEILTEEIDLILGELLRNLQEVPVDAGPDS